MWATRMGLEAPQAVAAQPAAQQQTAMTGRMRAATLVAVLALQRGCRTPGALMTMRPVSQMSVRRTPIQTFRHCARMGPPPMLAVWATLTSATPAPSTASPCAVVATVPDAPTATSSTSQSYDNAERNGSVSSEPNVENNEDAQRRKTRRFAWKNTHRRSCLFLRRRQRGRKRRPSDPPEKSGSSRPSMAHRHWPKHRSWR
mmetsp:Transcript_26324/g.51570  ORF Transcript_26324/g.51570 Transcript_26324/m.51570 type:complete len:201 (-) Transcript_26324:726-1328(-)